MREAYSNGSVAKPAAIISTLNTTTDLPTIVQPVAPIIVTTAPPEPATTASLTTYGNG